MSASAVPVVAPPLTATGRYLILATAFLGWMFAGTLMAITPLMSRSAVISLSPGTPESELGKWFAWYNASFLFGAAAGGLLFGWLGDRSGRVKAMGGSILCFTGFSGLSYFVTTPEQLLVLRFLACLGVGGMWPNGIALASEAWSEVSRLTLAGLIGTAANVGLVILALIATQRAITPEDWRWVLVLVAVPLPLGLIVLAFVPESPRWLEAQANPQPSHRTPAIEIFRPPLLKVTIIGICLGTIPLLGGWGSANWLVPWADMVGGKEDAIGKAWTQVSRSSGGAISSLLGGWLAGLVGRRKSYFFISVGALLVSEYIFNWLTPAARGVPTSWNYLLGLLGQGESVPFSAVNWFNFWAFMLGVMTGFYFGWLPLCLPEMFPTRVRSTGAGVTFNFGRVAAAVGVLGAGELIKSHYQGDYARVGSVTSLIYVLGMVIIWFAPDTSGKKLE